MTDTASSEPTALIVIDMQEGFNDASYWGTSSNPEAESNVQKLVDHWVLNGWPVVSVTHNSDSADSPLNPAQPGNALMEILREVPFDLELSKRVNSAFYGSVDLHAWLQERGISHLVMCGIQSNMCVETTTRMAGNLDYQVALPIDATRTFGMSAELAGMGTVTLSADELMRASALNLHAGGFARVVSTADLVASA